MKKVPQKTAHSKRDHAEFSASGAERWLNCPGSLNLSKKAPPQPESKYATEGTQAHECLEFLLKNSKVSVPNITIQAAEKLYPREMVTYAVEAAEWVFANSGEEDEILSETKIDSSHFTCTGQFGTLDAAIVRPWGVLTVIDYKYGAGYAVDPKDNPQLIYYALGLSFLYDHAFSEVELVIIQPRAYHEEGTIRTHRMGMAELLSWQDKFRNGVMETSDAKAPLKSGTWCKWCPAAPICPELKERSLERAKIVFSDTDGLSSLPDIKKETLPNLGTILDACEKLEDWIKSVRDHAAHVLERGGEVPGFKMVWKKSPRRWANLAEASLDAKNEFGIVAFAPPELLSPAQLEKAMSQRSGFTDLETWISERVTNESSGTTLVRESDKRPAVTPAKHQFTKLPVAK